MPHRDHAACFSRGGSRRRVHQAAIGRHDPEIVQGEFASKGTPGGSLEQAAEEAGVPVAWASSGNATTPITPSRSLPSTPAGPRRPRHEAFAEFDHHARAQKTDTHPEGRNSA